MRKIIALALLFTASLPVLAESECTPNLIKEDVCKIASGLAAESKSVLPIKITDGMEMYAIEARGNALVSHIRLSATESDMQAVYLREKVSPGLVKARVRMQTANNACAPKNPIRSFINLGGEVHYDYTFPSGKTYDSFSVVYCK